MALGKDLVWPTMFVPLFVKFTDTVIVGARDPYAIDDEDIVMVNPDDAEGEPKAPSRESRHSERRSRKKVRGQRHMRVISNQVGTAADVASII